MSKKKQSKAVLTFLDDEVMEFRSSLDVETDRGVALVCAAYLEEQLEMLLRKSFVNAPSVVDKLFEGSGPVSTFASKIDLVFAVGSIQTQAHRALHLIRKIRNDFAHQHKMLSFTDESISARCGQLSDLNPFPKGTAPRDLFIRATMTILAMLHAKEKRTRHRRLRTGASSVVESNRPLFESVRSSMNEIVSSLNDDQKRKLQDPKLKTAELKRLVVESLERVLGSEEAQSFFKLTRVRRKV